MSNEQELREYIKRLESSRDYTERIRQQHIDNSAHTVRERYGLEPGELQWRWRKSPPDTFDFAEAQAAVIDALCREGIPAWSGDATSCVTQIIEAVYKKLGASNERVAALEAKLDAKSRVVRAWKRAATWWYREFSRGPQPAADRFRNLRRMMRGLPRKRNP